MHDFEPHNIMAQLLARFERGLLLVIGFLMALLLISVFFTATSGKAYLASPQFTDLAAPRGMRLLRKLRRVAVPHKQFATRKPRPQGDG
ncbi:MAG: hypothetical protein WC091_21035 [Sulfuricellaceae bacterium]